MDDLYVECLVAKKSRPADVMIKGVTIGLTVALILFGMLTGSMLLFVIGVAAAGMCWFFLPNLSLEYEYLFVSKTLEVDKIMSKQKRKKVCEYDLEKMEIFAEEGAYQLDDFKNLKTVEKDYTSREKDKDIWIMLIHQGKDIERLRLEPSEQLINAFRNQYPRKTFKKM